LKVWFKKLISDVLTDVCLRFATETSEGEGWSEFGGDGWVYPIDEFGVLQFIDDNDVQRIVVIDKNDHYFYEIDTVNKSTIIKPFATDKIDVDESEITWLRRGIEHIASIGSEEKKLLHDKSYVVIREDDVNNRGASHYTSTGQREKQKLTLKVYEDGEQSIVRAESENIPEGGEVVFTGRKIESNRIMIELSGTAGEINVIGLNDDFLIEQKAPSRSLRKMIEHTLALSLLADKILHVTRSKTFINRVTGEVLDTNVTRITGPDNKEYSAFKLANDINLRNDEIPGEFTIVIWARNPQTNLELIKDLDDFSLYSYPGSWDVEGSSPT
jgi:hypothetical protein